MPGDALMEAVPTLKSVGHKWAAASSCPYCQCNNPLIVKKPYVTGASLISQNMSSMSNSGQSTVSEERRNGRTSISRAMQSTVLSWTASKREMSIFTLDQQYLVDSESSGLFYKLAQSSQLQLASSRSNQASHQSLPLSPFFFLLLFSLSFLLFLFSLFFYQRSTTTKFEPFLATGSWWWTLL